MFCSNWNRVRVCDSVEKCGNVRQYEFESFYLRFYSKKLMQKSFTEDHIEISVFIVCFILSSCH